MADADHLAQLKKGVAAWNSWRVDNVDILPDLTEANLRGADLSGAAFLNADLRGADLSGADLTGADLTGADLSEANLQKAKLTEAHLNRADLGRADLTEADLRWSHLNLAYLGWANLSAADLSGADLGRVHLQSAKLGKAKLIAADLSGAVLLNTDLSEADLSEANLQGASLMETNLTGADLTGCYVYGASAWGLKLEKTNQQNLVITRHDLPYGEDGMSYGDDEPKITVDNIEVAQFVYLLLHNKKIRDMIDTIGKKGVLLLGRFTEGRMEILERLREKLRSLGFVPMVFNFDKPETKDFTETVRLLANLSHFVIVDITNPRSAPLELQAMVPDYMIPFVPILEEGQDPFAMFVDLQNKYDWVLEPVIGYSSVDRLIEVFEDKIVKPAEAKFNQLLARRTKQLRVENV